MNIKSNFLKESFGINSIKSSYAQLFYIYDNNKKQIIFIGSTSDKGNSNNGFFDSFLFATFATDEVSKIFIPILYKIRNKYKPL